MRYVFRADASHDIGAGHVMRCSTIAEEVIARGLEAIFVGRIENLEWVRNRIHNLGFSSVFENEDEFLSNPDSDVLVLDSYLIGVEEPFISRRKWKMVVLIADNVTPKFECDLIIHPGLDNEWLKDSVIPVLYGPEYLLIRKSIKKITGAQILPETGPRIVVVGGGSDSSQFCRAVAIALKSIQEPFTAVLFTNDMFEAKLDKRFMVSPIGDALDEMIKDTNLVLTPASTSSFEFIAREIPMGIACAAENQRLNFKTLVLRKLAYPIGIYSNKDGWAIDGPAIHRLIIDADLRKELKGGISALIDLQGPKRIVDTIHSLS
jgi:spore coat polysaccharide biosynthesis predicted glycosyltransferase SpsG